VPLAEVTARLAEIAEVEGVSIDPAALTLIAREGTGSVRDSISLLDQLIADPNAHISLDMAEQILGTASGQNIVELADALIASDAARGLDLINAAVDGGADPRQLGQQVIAHLRQVLLVKMGGEALVDSTEERRAVLREQAEAIGRKTLIAAIRAFNGAVAEWRAGWQPQLPLELAFLESIKPVAEEEPEPAPRPAAHPRPRTQHDLPPPVEEQEVAPPPAAPVAPAASIPGGPSRVHVADVLSAWAQVQKSARAHHPSLPALLEHVTPRDVRGDQLVLSVRSDIFKQKIEVADKRAALEEALYAVLGVPLKVSVIVVDEAHVKTPGANDVLATDDVLAFGVNELGGEITDLDDEE
jgi:DNA polymerase-3 subunit gamma/tau